MRIELRVVLNVVCWSGRYKLSTDTWTNVSLPPSTSCQGELTRAFASQTRYGRYW